MSVEDRVELNWCGQLLSSGLNPCSNRQAEGILTCELQTSLPHSCTLEVIPLMGEVVEKVTSAVVDNDNLSAGVIKKQVDI